MMWLAISIVHRTERPFATTGRINHLLVKDHRSLNDPVVFELWLPCAPVPALSVQLWNFRDSCVARLGGSPLF